MEQEYTPAPSAILPAGPVIPTSFEDRASELVRAFLSGRSERTLKAYRQDLEVFRTFLGLETVDQAAKVLLSSEHGRANALGLAFKTDMVERGLSPSTVNRRLAALRSLVKLGRVLGMISWTLEVPNEKTESYRETGGPGLDGVRRLLEELDKRVDVKAKRDRAAVRLLFDIALRRGEVVSLDIEDVDLEEGRISVLRKGKREKIRLSLPDPTREALTEWMDHRGADEGPLFTNFDHAGKGERLTGTSLYRIVRDLGMEAGIKARPHGLRHTAITEAVKASQEAGITLDEVRDFSGHADVKTLMIYRDRERNVQGKLASLVALGA